MNSSQGFDFTAILPLIILGIGIAIPIGLLAKEKGRNVKLWVILSFIPMINFWCLPFFVGASNLRLEKKLDAILEKLDRPTN